VTSNSSRLKPSSSSIAGRRRGSGADGDMLDGDALAGDVADGDGPSVGAGEAGSGSCNTGPGLTASRPWVTRQIVSFSSVIGVGEIGVGAPWGSSPARGAEGSTARTGAGAMRSGASSRRGSPPKPAWSRVAPGV
jgi:hypothetical protein